MRIRWDEAKRQQVLQRRKIDFAHLNELFVSPMSKINGETTMNNIA
jgi:uncharacterized DUF497 family protein